MPLKTQQGFIYSHQATTLMHTYINLKLVFIFPIYHLYHISFILSRNPPEVAHFLGCAGRSEAARYGAGDTVQARHDQEGGDVVVEGLARSDGEVVDQTEGVNTVDRREQDLTLHQVAVMLHELHHHVSSRAVTHQYEVLIVQEQTRVEPRGVELVLEVVLHPGLDTEHPLRLVVGGGVGEESPALDHHNPVTGNSTTSTVTKVSQN